MKDKERILMVIISRIVPALSQYGIRKEDYFKPFIMDTKQLHVGDLVLANTAITPNPYMVGYVHEIKNDCVVIREIGSQKLCNYYNEMFSIINKDVLGYEILEGLQYKIYQKVLKAFDNYTGYTTRFRSIEFSDDICTVTSREIFKNDKCGEVSFKYDKHTKISDIGKVLEDADM